MKELLEKYKVVTKIPVQWGEMDAFQHVNNVVYLRWIESARINYFQKISLTVEAKEVGPILGWQDCKYIFPMTYPDTAIVGARVVEIKEDRFIVEGAIFSEKLKRICAISKQSVVPFNYKEQKKAAIPKGWLDAIHQLEGEIDFPVNG